LTSSSPLPQQLEQEYTHRDFSEFNKSSSPNVPPRGVDMRVDVPGALNDMRADIRVDVPGGYAGGYAGGCARCPALFTCATCPAFLLLQHVLFGYAF